MNESFNARLVGEIETFKRDGVYKRFNHLNSPQAARVEMEGRGEGWLTRKN